MKVAGIRSTECREFLDKLQLPIAPLEKLGTEISLGARRRSLDKANPDEEQGVRFLDDLELACATRAQLLVSDEKLSIPPTECRSIDDVRERKPMLALPGEMQEGASTGFAEGLVRSEEHTSELQSLMRISYAVFCLKKQKNKHYY